MLRQVPPLPWAIVLIAAGVVGIFLWELRAGTTSALAFGFSPARFWTAMDAVTAQWQISLTPLSALFIHLDWPHLIGNLVFLLLFGLRVERRLGGWQTLGLFTLGGALANVVAGSIAATSTAPVIGASGATSALIGAFVVFYPRTQIGLILPLGVYLQTVKVPSLIVIGTWIALQLLYTVTETGLATVAWWTHIAGFAIGVLWASLVRLSRPLNDQRQRQR